MLAFVLGCSDTVCLEGTQRVKSSSKFDMYASLMEVTHTGWLWIQLHCLISVQNDTFLKSLLTALHVQSQSISSAPIHECVDDALIAQLSC